ncbi:MULTISPECIES: carbamoyltransferase HypF [Pseudomonadota]|jgi:hydrogenase maturation protein HypF|uniref:carbamoyltransferase HypF n=1 Tax=Pseudomonadota TaxID=1224 RepID=UPI0025BFCF39|nr:MULTISPECIES: carbamoyltransferase HypF [Pseudomonadota]|tara:strand:+ start:15065 stop:17449 length:2385 start_codon:yes stop_codon:yes gene_type:complete
MMSDGAHAVDAIPIKGEAILIRGQVQGVGFRPTVWKLATDLGLRGDVCNTANGVLIHLWGDSIDQFVTSLPEALPPLAKIDRLTREQISDNAPNGFEIIATIGGDMRVSITPDAASCTDCNTESFDAFERRYRYPFTNCTNCGPRFSIIDGAPYDREKTSMRAFSMCADCQQEYDNPKDRRMHAQPVACHVCGPKAWIEKLGGGVVNCEAFSMMDDVDATGGMLMMGHIVAIKGIGGVHLACDATKADVVASLRAKKGRKDKAFALMAKTVDIIRQYCEVSEAEEAVLKSVAAPIVLLKAKPGTLPEVVAPGLNRLGFMLPYTPLHHLMLRRMKRPIVMTSGNKSGAPQCITNEQTRKDLAQIADFACLHDRDIINRVDDSVASVVAGRERVIRRARGYAPQSLDLPDGFVDVDDLLAMGGDYKNTFCLVKNGQTILSQHLGDMEHPAARDEAVRNLSLYQNLFDHKPNAIAVDAHPAFASSEAGRGLSREREIPLIEIQHHHAHIASCMAENNWPLDAGRVLGVALDGTGWGPDGTVWGGEFMACDYRSYERLGQFKPVALPGGEQAVRQPWRNAYAHIRAEMGWAEFAMNFADLDIFKYLNEAPRETLDGMMASGTQSPLASSCGRLFDAAAAITGLLRDEQSYEGHAAMLFEASIDPAALNEPDSLKYPFSIPLHQETRMPYIEPLGAWRAMLGDLVVGTPIGTISARFHRGLASVIVQMVAKLSGSDRKFETIALSGGCFQNRTLFQLVHDQLQFLGYRVLSHSQIPANDGGLSLGQAVIAAASLQPSPQ